MAATIVTFRPTRDKSREIAFIGLVEVGYVMLLPQASGPATPHWKALLPTETAAVLASASTWCEAKRSLVMRIADWFECLGPAFQEIARGVRSEAMLIAEASAVS